MENKAVLLSIRPKWCCKIANGEKTAEVRRSRPKTDTPFTCYIYCSKPSKSFQTICGSIALNNDELYRHPQEGIKYGDSVEMMLCDGYTKDNFLNGKITGEFTCDKIWELAPLNHAPDDIEEQLCLTREDIVQYIKGKGFAWHISNLRIYDKPRELSEFEHPYDCDACDAGWASTCNQCAKDRVVKNAPMSWMYVEGETL